jgi:hypothetical protein
MVVSVQTSPTLGVSPPKGVYDLRQLRIDSETGSQWDFLADGRMIAIQKGDSEHDVSSFSIVLHWIDEVRTRVARR